jgi:hypothetical protein
MKVVSLAAVLTGRLYTPGSVSGTHFLDAESTEGQSEAEELYQ